VSLAESMSRMIRATLRKAVLAALPPEVRNDVAHKA
jgi:hypothetical protein